MLIGSINGKTFSRLREKSMLDNDKNEKRLSGKMPIKVTFLMPMLILFGKDRLEESILLCRNL